MTNTNLTELLNTFDTYWHEALNGDHKNSRNLKFLAEKLQKMELEIDQNSLSLTERTILARATILASI